MRESVSTRCPDNPAHEVSVFDPRDPDDPWIVHVCDEPDCREEWVVHEDDLR